MGKKSGIKKIEPAILSLVALLDDVAKECEFSAIREEIGRLLKKHNRDAFDAFDSVMAIRDPNNHRAAHAHLMIGEIDGIDLTREGFDLNVYIFIRKQRVKVISHSDGGGVVSHCVSRLGIMRRIDEAS